MIMEDVVQLMRSDIDVEIEGQGKESFRVTYESEEPTTAYKVTERLASLYIEENLKDKENLNESTHLFLESELEDAKRRLLEQEEKVESYRRQYAGQLPSQLDTNQQAIQNAQLQLSAVSESINRARERRLLVQRQLGDAQSSGRSRRLCLDRRPPAARPVTVADSGPATRGRRGTAGRIQAPLQAGSSGYSVAGAGHSRSAGEGRARGAHAAATEGRQAGVGCRGGQAEADSGSRRGDRGHRSADGCQRDRGTSG